jgi:hypothetical protein
MREVEIIICVLMVSMLMGCYDVDNQNSVNKCLAKDGIPIYGHWLNSNTMTDCVCKEGE